MSSRTVWGALLLAALLSLSAVATWALADELPASERSASDTQGEDGSTVPEPQDDGGTGEDGAQDGRQGRDRGSRRGREGGSGEEGEVGDDGATTGTVPAGGSPIGYLGCSQSRHAVHGYVRLGGTRFWTSSEQVYSGGDLESWTGDGDRFWGVFENFLAERPTTTLWWQLCTHVQQSDAEQYANALTVLDGIERRAPDATVYVSAQNGYVPPHVCPASGPEGPGRMQELADRLVAEGRAQAGPDVGDLRGSDSTGGGENEVADDGCHANEPGSLVLGQALADFFS